MSRLLLLVSLLLLTMVGPTQAQEKFKESELSFPNGKDTYYGTLTLPTGGQSPYPAVLLFSGSGPTDRDGNTRLIPGKVDSHLVLAHALAEGGIASFRYDKLFSGKTGMATHAKDYGTIGYDNQLNGAQAAYHLLQARPEVDPKRMGLLGHSEGGLTALCLAQKDQPVAVALLAPLSRPYLGTLKAQIDAQYDRAAAAGALTSKEAAAGKAELAAILEQLKAKGTVPAKIRPEFQPLFLPANLRFLHTVSAYDPAAMIAQLPATMPVLLLAGERDIQVLPVDVQALAKAGGRTCTVVAKANHVFKLVEKPGPNPVDDYGNSKLPFAEEARKAVVSFFCKSFGI